ncbi:dolichyl-diphosphooligosaccharide--protein glycosyltransferase subunit 2-like isoform X1 [Arachis stenosperma]|uniref:dolichyl-diphosphooligosaccharide--protein glycosyltransferase subunit 2-like isoform X1 n=1 Tax=Arachis stenosperma TaxID=217475 RepID=UPI0025AD846D|nr:dolichyl-diphosphooligosaccharide--protein glycosyltransferase subunit 2-like isoform X1 [Arachis stenosperma]XP_057751950.1 dolichyl-diphosphooligosaccharide--protein glycosyltransferase subunit 2-like isoform X1 [Arachis stenosperma]
MAFVRAPSPFVLVLVLALSISAAITATTTVPQPISDHHRSAALNLFAPSHGSFPSLQDAYEALRVFEILGIEEKHRVSTDTCKVVLENLSSLSSSLKDLFYALKVNGILKCKVNGEVFEGIASRLKASISDASPLPDLYYSIGSLVLIKDQDSNVDVLLADAMGTFQSIKAQSQSDGKWRYSSDKTESSAYAAGLAFEALAGVISLASSEIDQSKVNTVKHDILKLFDSIEKNDDGSFYFDGETVGRHEHQDSLSTTSSVVRGVTAFAAAVSGEINQLPGDKTLGLAKFLLGIGVPGDAKDFFNQVESLAFLESKRVTIPLILSLPETVYSLTTKGQLKVRVSTALGSAAPPLVVKLVRAFSSGAKDSSIIESKELQYDKRSGLHVLDGFTNNVDVGTYVFVFEIVLHDSHSKQVYATGGQIHIPIYVTGIIAVSNAEIGVLGDLGSVQTKKALDLAGNDVVSFSANHLQKLRFSFQLATPHGHVFKPHQAILKFRHEIKVEHVFVIGNVGKKFEITLDFLGLVEKLFYLSGKYDIELTVGDAAMENSFIRLLGHVKLDLPEAPEKAAQPPAPPVDPYSRYGPKTEITHLFRTPEKRPPQNVSITFLGLILLPFLGFLIGLLRLGVNLKNFPSSTVPAAFAMLFQLSIAAVLLLYVLFWLKLDLFTTLKTLGFLGAFLMFSGHRILSYLASTSTKLKSA